MALSSPYLSTTWTRSTVADTLRRVIEDHRKAVGDRLRDLRKSRGLSQEDAAHAVGVVSKTWGDWERGRRDPYDSNWKKIGEVFDVDPARIRGAPPAPLGLAREDQVDGVADEFRSYVRELLAGLGGLAAHDGQVSELLSQHSGLLSQQGEVLEAIRALLTRQSEILERIERAEERIEGLVASLPSDERTEELLRAWEGVEAAAGGPGSRSGGEPSDTGRATRSRRRATGR